MEIEIIRIEKDPMTEVRVSRAAVVHPDYLLRPLRLLHLSFRISSGISIPPLMLPPPWPLLEAEDHPVHLVHQHHHHLPVEELISINHPSYQNTIQPDLISARSAVRVSELKRI